MEISAQDLAAIFDKHRESSWRWHLGRDPATDYPCCVDLAVTGYELKDAILSVTLSIGPRTIKTVAVPLLFALDTWDHLHVLVTKKRFAPESAAP